MKKETQEHFKILSSYLPYTIQMFFEKSGSIKTLTGIKYDYSTDEIIYCFDKINHISTYWNYIPILHPLSDLTEKIEIDGKCFIPIVILRDIALNGKIIKNQWEMLSFMIRDSGTDKENLPLWVIQKLLEWHFDVLGLIEKGLAIDINTINK